MASVVVKQRSDSALGAAASDVTSLLGKLFPDVPISDVQQLHINRTSDGVQVICIYHDELGLAEAAALLESGEQVCVVEVIP